MACKAAECSGPHDQHDCHGCLRGANCLGWTQDELKLMTEKTRLYCMLLDRGLSHEQIRRDAYPNTYQD